MVSVSMLVIYVGLCLFTYLLDMFYGWEIIFTAVLMFPVWSYVRNKKVVWSMLYIIQSCVLFARLTVSSMLAKGNLSIPRPISLEVDIIKQFSGLIMIIGWFVWLVYITLFTCVNLKYEIDKCDDIKQLSENKVIIRVSNLFTVTVVSLLLFVVIAGPAYKLTAYLANISLFIICIIAVAIAVSLLQINWVRIQKEKIIMREREELVIVDLNDEPDKENIEEVNPEEDIDNPIVEDDTDIDSDVE